MPRAARRSITLRWSVQVWWPIPRDPVWSITQTCPVSRPMAAAAAASRTWSTTWTSRKWLPPPRLPSCGAPRVAARSDTWAGSAPGTVPPSSQAAASSSTPIPWASGWRTPSTRTRSTPAGRAAAARPRPARGGCAWPGLTSRRSGRGRRCPSRDRCGAGAPRSRCRSRPRPARRPAGGDVGGRHPADREAVAPVDVGHGVGGADDPGQGGHVRHLLHRLVLDRPGEQSRWRHDDPARFHVPDRDLPDRRLQPPRLRHRGRPRPPRPAWSGSTRSR